MSVISNFRRPFLFASLAATFFLAVAPAAQAQQFARIEEDWELILNTPDLSFPSPQLVVSMKPNDASDLQALFLINHHDTPTFNAGGGQIQIWDGEALRSYKSFTGPTLIREGERVTWTQYMDRTATQFQFGLKAVEGEAWGTNTAETLGGPIAASSLNLSLDGYDSNDSIEHATLTFGEERVRSLRLVEVRKYRYAGDPDPVTEGPRTVFPLPE
ncbi:MAG: hypothetical protein WBC44_06595 [Planctomycetaceae bacterium]